MTLITQGNNHIFICGMTRSGKTYFATRALSELPDGVLFINLQNADMPRRFIDVSADEADLEQIVDSLKSGAKINLTFPPVWGNNSIMAVIGYLSRQLLRQGFSEKKPIYIGYDECQAFTKECLPDVRLVATRGLYLGCRAVFITQRPALADLTFYTQAAEHYIFQLGQGERGYFKEKGIDYDRCLELWQQLGQHSYVFTDGFKIEGREKV